MYPNTIQEGRGITNVLVEEMRRTPPLVEHFPPATEAAQWWLLAHPRTWESSLHLGESIVNLHAFGVYQDHGLLGIKLLLQLLAHRHNIGLYISEPQVDGVLWVEVRFHKLNNSVVKIETCTL
ncbi:hypothetical protein LSAT2_014627 [Lamellibrachia satsuma]|nr:hypothetical protein LSAT2_014627 [Lamellibrachia satsuma]